MTPSLRRACGVHGGMSRISASWSPARSSPSPRSPSPPSPRPTRSPRPAPRRGVREFAGTIVFSQFDPAQNQYFLTVRRAGAAAPERLPVAPSGRTFDADIGPDSNGNPELIYQRCSPPPGVPRGCDLFVLSLSGTTGERPVRNANDPDHNDTNATIWRGRIAWSRDYGAGSEPTPIVYTKTLHRLARAALAPPARRAAAPHRRRRHDVSGPTTGRSVPGPRALGREPRAHRRATAAAAARASTRASCASTTSATARPARSPSRSSACRAKRSSGRRSGRPARLVQGLSRRPVGLPAGPGRAVPLRPDRADLPALAGHDPAGRRLHRHRRAAVRGARLQRGNARTRPTRTAGSTPSPRRPTRRPARRCGRR